MIDLLLIQDLGELVAALGGLLVGWLRPWQLLWTNRGGPA